MRKFILQLSLFLLLVAITFTWMLFKADGYTDAFYVRFTTPKQNSLILGSSRAAQGVHPQVFAKIMNLDIFNYAFTIHHSPYGEEYLKSIKKKLNPESNDGTFIITVDPWSISSLTSNPNDSLKFRELNKCVSTTKIVDLNPNYDYLINNYVGRYYELIFNKSSQMFLHDDGWLEVSISMDSLSNELRIKNKIKSYRLKNLPYFKFSSLRFKYLLKTINYLKNFGKVYLVQLPIHVEMEQIEEEFMPDFDSKIQELVPHTSGYLNLTEFSDLFIYTDGNHLHKESGKLVTQRIAKWIQEQ
jgi:hypothetical protein